MKCKTLTILIFLFSIQVLPFNNSLAEGSDVTTGNSFADTIINGLRSLSCETMKMYEVFIDGEFKNSCVTYPMFNMLIGSLIYADSYPGTISRLRINDRLLFGEDQCSIANRANPYDPRLTFGMCSNVEIFKLRLELFGEAAYKLFAAFGSGDWDALWKKLYDIISPGGNDSYYRRMFTIYDKKVGDSGTFWDFPVGGLNFRMPWKVFQNNDSVCLGTVGIFGELFGDNNYIAVGCKYMHEPYPESIYASVVNGDSGSSGEGHKVTCSNMGNCYKDVTKNSKYLRPMSSLVIYCLNQMLVKMLVNPDVCSVTDINNVKKNLNISKKSTFYQFQNNMRTYVKILLTMYVIFFGMKMILTGEVTKNTATIFILKMLLVSYFAVGIAGPDHETKDSIGKFLVPLLFDAANEFASWISNLNYSGLCDFNSQHYQEGYKFLSLWDSLDCRVGHYLGLDMITEFYAENFKQKKDWVRLFTLTYPVPFYFYLLAIGLYLGSMNIILIALSYPIMVISVAAFLVQSFATAMIMIMILATLSPIFVPMALFERTKSYFNSWLQLFMSLSLTPMVATAFIITMFAVYDRGFYGTCTYNSTPITLDGRTSQVFTIKYNKEDYPDVEDYKNCSSSLGYILNYPISVFFYESDNNPEEFVNNTRILASTDNRIKNDPALSGSIKKQKGIFADYFDMLFDKIQRVVLSLLTACITLYLIHHLSGQLGNFVKDLTLGIDLESISPKETFAALTKAISMMGSAAGIGKKPGDDKSLGGDESDKSGRQSINVSLNQTTNDPKQSISVSINSTDDSKKAIAIFQGDGALSKGSGSETPSRKNIAITFGEANKVDSTSLVTTLRKLTNEGGDTNVVSGIDKHSGTTEQEFARYITMINNDKLYEKHQQALKNETNPKDTVYKKAVIAYQTSLEKYLKNSENLENADALTLKLESELGGEGAKRLREINNKVLNDLGINRTKALEDVSTQETFVKQISDNKDGKESDRDALQAAPNVIALGPAPEGNSATSSASDEKTQQTNEANRTPLDSQAIPLSSSETSEAPRNVAIAFGKSNKVNSQKIIAALNEASKEDRIDGTGSDFEKHTNMSEQEFANNILVINNTNLHAKSSSYNDGAVTYGQAAYDVAVKNYKEGFEKYLNSGNNIEKADEIALRLEASIGGEGATNLRKINTDILNDLGISRTTTLEDIGIQKNKGNK